MAVSSERHKTGEDLMARRLAALGDSFMKAFDDVSSSDDIARRSNEAQTSDSASKASDSAQSNVTGPEEDDDQSADDTAACRNEDAPVVLEFAGNAVRQKGNVQPNSRRQQQATAGAATAQSLDTGMSTWTGSRSEIISLQRQVQTYGAAALDKKSKKQFEAKQLARLGAKAAKAPRMPASVGQGMKRKHDMRAERAQEEAIAAGMTSRRDIAKLKRRAKDAERRNRDRGLEADGGRFKGGVLKLPAQGFRSKQRRGRR